MHSALLSVPLKKVSKPKPNEFFKASPCDGLRQVRLGIKLKGISNQRLVKKKPNKQKKTVFLALNN